MRAVLGLVYIAAATAFFGWVRTAEPPDAYLLAAGAVAVTATATAAAVKSSTSASITQVDDIRAPYRLGGAR